MTLLVGTTPRTISYRRGAALLIVLATLILTMTAMTILAQASASIYSGRTIDRCGRIADDLLTAADAPIQAWLRDESSKVSLPTDAQTPSMAVLHDVWMIDGVEQALTITAYDQLGMVPVEAVRSGTPLRLTLSTEVIRAVDSLKDLSPSSKSPLGLDLFARSDDSRTVPVFPHMATGADRAAAIGELIATHNSAPPRLNVNTAPMALVEAAMRLAGRGGTEQVMAARKAGKFATVGSASSPVSAEAKFVPQIVSSSTCWSFRIDVRVGPLWRSWWATYEPGESGKWKCVQRLAITE
jgi:hypothetical protein